MEIENRIKENNLEKRVLDKIKSGEVKMKPRFYFILMAVFFILGILLIFLSVVFVISFIVFSMRISGMWFLPSFGLGGIELLLSSLPWMLILIAAMLIIILETFTKKFSFVGSKPLIYSLVAIFSLSLVVGLAVAFSPFHENLFANSRQGGLSLIGYFYREYGSTDLSNFHNGSVLKITNYGFDIVTPGGAILVVIANDAMKQGIGAGDSVLVVGLESKGVIQASLLRKINENADFFPDVQNMK